jgi:protein-S-isoprenylcysteine O-methyltransferase Ste14
MKAENVTKIVKHGPYAVVRHPIYLADLVAILIIIIAYPMLWIIVGSFMAVPIIMFWAKKEEEVLIQRFGTEYEDYTNEKSAFNPFPFLIKMIMMKK